MQAAQVQVAQVQAAQGAVEAGVVLVWVVAAAVRRQWQQQPLQQRLRMLFLWLRTRPWREGWQSKRRQQHTRGTLPIAGCTIEWRACCAVGTTGPVLG